MNITTLTALKGSIKKWEDIVAGTEADEGTRNCSLCHLFHVDFNPLSTFANCTSCPVFEKTGFQTCTDSPYEDWSFFFREHGFGTPRNVDRIPLEYRDQAIALAQAEVDFLKSLIPKCELCNERPANTQLYDDTYALPDNPLVCDECLEAATVKEDERRMEEG